MLRLIPGRGSYIERHAWKIDPTVPARPVGQRSSYSMVPLWLCVADDGVVLLVRPIATGARAGQFSCAPCAEADNNASCGPKRAAFIGSDVEPGDSGGGQYLHDDAGSG